MRIRCWSAASESECLAKLGCSGVTVATSEVPHFSTRHPKRFNFVFAFCSPNVICLLKR
jgi:hypothetical protein